MGTKRSGGFWVRVGCSGPSRQLQVGSFAPIPVPDDVKRRSSNPSSVQVFAASCPREQRRADELGFVFRRLHERSASIAPSAPSAPSAPEQPPRRYYWCRATQTSSDAGPDRVEWSLIAKENCYVPSASFIAPSATVLQGHGTESAARCIIRNAVFRQPAYFGLCRQPEPVRPRRSLHR